MGSYASYSSRATLRPSLWSREFPMKSQLRELRSGRGWSQGELAARLRVSRQTVNAIETEKYDPSLPLAFAIARLFELRIEDVFQPDSAPPKAKP